MDVRRGLIALRGKHDKLISLLRSMANSHRDDMELLEARLRRVSMRRPGASPTP
jgi:hypothetical protein